MSGQRIFQYEILEKLGEGGMGVVYKAHDTKLHRTVALKSLRSVPSITNTDKVRLIAEARTAAALNHPNICSVIDILDHDGDQYIVLEYVEGESLRSRILQRKMGMAEILECAVQIAEGLSEAHRKGVVHRDIKPENVIVNPSGRVKIMDFGIARQVGGEQLTQQGTVLGTITYMSPEQARGEPIDYRTDIWSFGVLLYEACTGVVPFASGYDQAVIYGILHETPKPLRAFNPNVPEGLERIVARCIAKVPADRYATMEECLADLEALRTGAKTGADSVAPHAQGNHRIPRIAYATALAIVVVLVVAALFLWPHKQSPAQKSSLAVLPFKNLSDKDEDAFFAEGLTEDIISQLGTAAELRVIGRSTTMRYRNSEKTLSEISSELGVAALLEGSVRHVGKRIRIVARLVDHSTGEDLWGETYDQNLHDILDIQMDIARRIASALRVHLAPVSGGQAEKKPVDLQAWTLYQKGRSEWYKRSTDGIKAAIAYYREALILEPDFALAHAGLADGLAALGDNGNVFVRPLDAFRQAKEEALKAVALDSNLAEGHAALGHLQMHAFQWEEAERSLRRAIELNPSYFVASTFLGLTYSAMGKEVESRAQVERAMLIDPLSIYSTSTTAMVYGRLGDFTAAISLLQRMLHIEPTSPRLHFALGRTYAASERPAEALQEYQLARIRQDNTEVRSSIAYAYALAGRTREAVALMDSLKRNMIREFVDPSRIAEIYTALGQKDQALDWLERAFREGSAGLVFVKTDPWYKSLRSEPRFKALLSAMGLSTSYNE